MLIVDDSEMIRGAVSHVVQQMGHRPVEAADGFEAMDAAARDTPDLIILDWVMPSKGGLETLKDLRAHPKFKNTPVVLLTVVQDKAAIREAGMYDVRDYMSKPASPDRIREKIRKYLG